MFFVFEYENSEEKTEKSCQLFSSLQFLLFMLSTLILINEPIKMFGYSIQSLQINWSSVCCFLQIKFWHFHCTENHIFFFWTPWKDGLSKKNCAGTWSFLYYWERWYFIFPKIWSYALDGKWRMIFLKKYMEIRKDGIFFPKTWSFFIVQKVKDGLSQEINGNMMYRPAKKNRKPDI